MQISNVSAGYTDSPALGRQGETIERLGTRPADAARLKTTASSPGQTSALGEILARYDVTDISPTEFSEMIQKLYEAGSLSEAELQQLAVIRLDLEAAGVEPDESIDLLDFYTRAIKKLQRRTDQPETPMKEARQFTAMLRRLDWMEKFALIQSAPDAVGLDAVV